MDLIVIEDSKIIGKWILSPIEVVYRKIPAPLPLSSLIWILPSHRSIQSVIVWKSIFVSIIGIKRHRLIIYNIRSHWKGNRLTCGIYEGKARSPGWRKLVVEHQGNVMRPVKAGIVGSISTDSIDLPPSSRPGIAKPTRCFSLVFTK